MGSVLRKQKNPAIEQQLGQDLNCPYCHLTFDSNTTFNQVDLIIN